MRHHWLYLKYVLRHKWFVLVAGRRIGGAPLWRLLIHDWSKFSPSEWGTYARFFYGHRLSPVRYQDWAIEEEKRQLQGPFDRAWLHHQHANPHHWQHWVLREDSGATKVLEMPEHFAREMVADWMGAGRAITGKWEAREWYEKNAGNILLAPGTRSLVAALLREECHCGAVNSKINCNYFGYCEAHMTPVEAQGGEPSEYALKRFRTGVLVK